MELEEALNNLEVDAHTPFIQLFNDGSRCLLYRVSKHIRLGVIENMETNSAINFVKGYIHALEDLKDGAILQEENKEDDT